MSWLTEYQKEHTRVLNSIDQRTFDSLLEVIMAAQKKKKKIFVIGNGGSAANASHFVEDLGKGAGDALAGGHFAKVTGVEVPRFRVLGLTDSVPYITALGNDQDFDQVFVGQLKTLADEGDLLIGISVSGTSPNLVEAFKWASKNKLKTVALVSRKARDKVDSIYAISNHLGICIDSEHYGIVEDVQMTLLHQICYYIMERLE